MAGGRKRKAGGNAATALRVLRGATRGRKAMTVAKRLKRVEDVTKTGAQDKKIWSYATTLNTVYVANPYLSLPTIARGTGTDEHIGNELFWQDFAFRYQITWTRIINNFNPHGVRIIVGLVRHTARTITTTDFFTEMFGSTSPNINQMYLLKSEGGKLGEKYIIVKDRIINRPTTTMFSDTISGTPTLAMSPARKYVQIKGSFKNNKAVYDNTSSTVPDKMRPFIAIFSDGPTGIGHSGGNELSIELKERIFFTENKVL